MPVAFGLIDPYSNRITTKNEITTILKKIFSSINRENIIFTTEGDFIDNVKKENIFKSIDNIYMALKDVCKEIDKENKVHKNENKEKKEKKKTTKTKKKVVKRTNKK